MRRPRDAMRVIRMCDTREPGVRVYLVDEPPARCGGHRVVQRPVVTRIDVIGGLAGVLVAPERYEGDVGPGAGARRDAVQLPARDRGAGLAVGETGVRAARPGGRREPGPGQAVVPCVDG